MNTLEQKLNELDNLGAVVEVTNKETENIRLTIETAEN